MMKKPELVIIKYGGGLITHKDQECHANIEHINRVSGAVKHLLDHNNDVIVIHGAGSFGHLKAKRWKLLEGKIYEGLPALISNATLKDDDINHHHRPQSQEEAVEAVRKDMKNLCDLVAQSLEEREISCRIFHPHTFMKGNDSSFEADVETIFEAIHYDEHSDNKRVIPILHGDVVEVSGTAKFGILSGDHIAERLVLESFRRNKNPESGETGKIWQKIHMVFAMTDVPGLMSHPPGHPDSVLIPKWNPDHSGTDDADTSNSILLDKTRLKHNSNIDVTGGIALKVDVASKMTEFTDNIWILDGRQPHRIIEAVMDASTEGTLISRHL